MPKKIAHARRNAAHSLMTHHTHILVYCICAHMLHTSFIITDGKVTEKVIDVCVVIGSVLSHMVHIIERREEHARQALHAAVASATTAASDHAEAA